ncbi:MAG: DEAD/DEAH box helicase [Paracoccus sp. (in: a-proteobacteria)]|nr:DEAD/DEAH box helicase [Paracoccus sp. (in: a-proteobacteria)]
MKDTELFDWLTGEAIRDDIIRLAQITVATEITNLDEINKPADPKNSFDWQLLLLAGSLLAKSVERVHQEAALRIATAAVTLETPPKVRDAGAVLLEKMSNHRSVELAIRRNRIAPDLEGRLGVSMRLEANRRRFEDSILLESSGKWIAVNDFQKELWAGASVGAGWLSASAPTASGKTYLVLQWLLDHIRTSKAKIAVYLAPTRALVSEIELSLKKLFRSDTGIEITSLPLTDVYLSSTAGDKKAVFVFTQERLHLLANLLGENFSVDLLIVDEAHKIGDNQRGVILQDAIERVSRQNMKMKVVFVSPSTQNPGELLQDAPEDMPKSSVDSDMPTVLQNVILAEQVPRKPKEWSLDLVWGSSTIPLGTLKLSNKPAGLKKDWRSLPRRPEGAAARWFIATARLKRRTSRSLLANWKAWRKQMIRSCWT